MADAAYLTESFLLYDNWPGVAVPPPFPVTGMTSAAVGHNVAHPRWDVGTKWELYCNGDQASVGVSYRQGFSTFIYLQTGPDAAASSPVMVKTMFSVPDEEIAAGDADDLIYVMAVDDDVTTHEYSGLVAVALSTQTNSYFGWYWCGGVYPVEYISTGAVADTVITNDSVTADIEIQTLLDAEGDTGVKGAIHATASQTPGIGISLITD